MNLTLGVNATAVGYLVSFWQTMPIRSAGAWMSPFGLAALALSAPLAVLLGLMLMDLLNYVLHIVAHKLPPLWLLHKIYHTDAEFGYDRVAMDRHPMLSPSLATRRLER